MKADTFTRRFANDIAATSSPYENEEHCRLLGWLEEFEGPCTEERGHALAVHLGTALEGYMGIERGILTAAFLAEYLERQRCS
jgi:hypothetical protein